MEKKESLHPGRLFGMGSAYWEAFALHAAVKLDVFTALVGKELTAPELAAELGCSERGMEPLLNALVAMDLLIKGGKLFRNAPLSETYLDRNKQSYVGHIIMHHHFLVEGWSRLADAVKTGQPVETESGDEELERESFLMGMFNLAHAIAPSIADSVELADRGHLLDLGGGPGTHAVFFCLAYPNLKATVFDRATTEPFAKEIFRRYGVEKRISFAAGDFHTDPFPEGFDVAWLSQILHSNTPDECRALIEKTAAVLEPGGMMLIHDFFLDEDMTSPLFPAIFSLNMLINNYGRSYSEDETRVMMAEAGLKDIKRLPFQSANDSSILSGIKP